MPPCDHEFKQSAASRAQGRKPWGYASGMTEDRAASRGEAGARGARARRAGALVNGSDAELGAERAPHSEEAVLSVGQSGPGNGPGGTHGQKPGSDARHL